jgi:hypothetical protein
MGEIHLGQNLLHAVKLDERHFGQPCARIC